MAWLILSVAELAVAGEEVLHIFTLADYFAPKVIACFERDHGCRVELDYFDSNEAMHVKILMGGGGYDSQPVMPEHHPGLARLRASFFLYDHPIRFRQ